MSTKNTGNADGDKHSVHVEDLDHFGKFSAQTNARISDVRRMLMNLADEEAQRPEPDQKLLSRLARMEEDLRKGWKTLGANLQDLRAMVKRKREAEEIHA